MLKHIALVTALAVAGSAAPVFADTQTVTGEVISLSCYFQNKANVGRAGAVCANATLKWEGNPAGLLAADGKVYQLAGGLVANNNAKVIPLIGHTVAVTGDVSKQTGMMVITADEAKLVK